MEWFSELSGLMQMFWGIAIVASALFIIQAILTFVGVNSKYFSGALDLLEKECGSMDAFLRGPLCLSDEDLAILRDRYLE